MASISQVKDFHDKYKIPRLEKPGFLSNEDAGYRINFLFEELNEFALNCGFGLMPSEGDSVAYVPLQDQAESMNLEEAFDGLLDLVYVALGTADMMGLASKLPIDVKSSWATIWWEGWTRVHNANMSKVLVENKNLSKRKNRWDVVKPKGWKKPEFKDLLR